MHVWRWGFTLAALLSGSPVVLAEDDGAVCGRAERVQGEALQEVIAACGRITRRQKTDAGKARVLRYRGIAFLRSGDPQAALPPSTVPWHSLPTTRRP